ncbi:methyltransferase domain-containing protein [Streptomyces sp. N2-109]|uniref:Protein-L-isoaspartate O-methyltransferase n=1 Tax=Streptomyces gossypii TaxID=2883101 RepID=A0ABT2JRI2_9ACTN|nr:methyltransferase domain-containing protein [Streptomyces gossypii]MCT2590504.1 methyltransferase domain-containing protein [Streptomyces gossypii]
MGSATALVQGIVAGGALADPAWRRAFEEVPRELFVPYYYTSVIGLGDEGCDRLSHDDPDASRRERWRRGVYEDMPLATLIRNGELLSSSSQPSLMARMLEALEVEEGMRVLEIGTGPGYNAALLSHRLGDERVTTVDIDKEITDAAREHLDAAGYHPAVVTGDGARGCPERAPYDRIIATCTLPSVPLPWLDQCAPGALILAPLATGLVMLRVADATHASGHFLDTPAYFVRLRGSPPAPAPGGCLSGLPAHAAQDDSFRFLLALTAGRVPPRAAYEIWHEEGRPARERYGVAVRGTTQWAWLDDPDGPYAWPLGD